MMSYLIYSLPQRVTPYETIFPPRSLTMFFHFDFSYTLVSNASFYLERLLKHVLNMFFDLECRMYSSVECVSELNDDYGLGPLGTLS